MSITNMVSNVNPSFQYNSLTKIQPESYEGKNISNKGKILIASLNELFIELESQNIILKESEEKEISIKFEELIQVIDYLKTNNFERLKLNKVNPEINKLNERLKRLNFLMDVSNNELNKMKSEVNRENVKLDKIIYENKSEKINTIQNDVNEFFDNQILKMFNSNKSKKSIDTREETKIPEAVLSPQKKLIQIFTLQNTQTKKSFLEEAYPDSLKIRSKSVRKRKSLSKCKNLEKKTKEEEMWKNIVEQEFNIYTMYGDKKPLSTENPSQSFNYQRNTMPSNIYKWENDLVINGRQKNFVFN